MINRILIMTAIMLGLIMITAPIAWMLQGRMGLAAAGLAAAICLIAGITGMLVGEALRSSNLIITQSLVPMLIRMGIALGVCMVISLRRGPLFQAGFVYYLLLFYLISLGPDTALLVRGLRASEAD